MALQLFGESWMEGPLDQICVKLKSVKADPHSEHKHGSRSMGTLITFSSCGSSFAFIRLHMFCLIINSLSKQLLCFHQSPLKDFMLSKDLLSLLSLSCSSVLTQSYCIFLEGIVVMDNSLYFLYQHCRHIQQGGRLLAILSVFQLRVT